MCSISNSFLELYTNQALKNRVSILKSAQFAIKYMKVFFKFIDQNIRDYQSRQIQRQSHFIQIRTLNLILEAQKFKFSARSLYNIENIYVSTDHLWATSTYINQVFSVGIKDLQKFKYFIGFSSSVTLQNINQTVVMVEDQLKVLQKRIGTSFLIMQSWMQKQNLYANMYVSAQKQQFRSNSFLLKCFEQLVQGNSSYIFSLLMKQKLNIQFWLNELWLLSLKLKKQFQKLYQNNIKSQLLQPFRINQAYGKKIFFQSIKQQIYKFYTRFLQQGQVISKNLRLLTQSCVQWINRQKQLRKEICNRFQGLALKIRVAFRQWQQELIDLQSLVQIFEKCWKAYFQKIKAQIQTVLSKYVVLHEPIRLGGKRKKAVVNRAADRFASKIPQYEKKDEACCCQCQIQYQKS